MKQKKGILFTEQRETLILMMEAVLAGGLAGLVSVIYRYSVTYAEKGLFSILSFVKENTGGLIVWLVSLALIGVIVIRLLKWEGFAGGSGVPQVMAEARGELDVPWHRTLFAKFISGTLCIFGGLSLGRTGPSIQLGAMTAKGYAKLRKHSREQELFLLSCGAAAGLAATFNAPLAGLFFMLEEIQGRFTKRLLVGGLFACAAASAVSQACFGSAPIFHYTLDPIPYTYAWLLLPFGILMGLGGACYNTCLLKVSALFKRIPKLPREGILAAVLVLSGITGLFLPQVLAGGKTMMNLLEIGAPTLGTVGFLCITKFLFTIFSAGSGAPGGLFFPILVLGSYLGTACGLCMIQLFSLPETWYAWFAILGLGGFFAAAIRTPLTAIFLAAELSQSPGLFFTLVLVTAISDLTAGAVGGKPICTTLMNQLLEKRTVHK